jgi:tRNA (guanine-N7-)-methyltransferase
MAVPTDRPHRNFYGRRKGKHLRDSQEVYLEQDLAGLSPGPVSMGREPGAGPARPRWPFRRARGLARDRVRWRGAHGAPGRANPDKGLIGCEPYINGVAMLLGKIRTSGVENLRVHPGDVRDLFDVLPDASVAKAFLLYPDPWPKTRHHRRRFVTPSISNRWRVF